MRQRVKLGVHGAGTVRSLALLTLPKSPIRADLCFNRCVMNRVFIKNAQVHEMNESRLGAKVFTILFDNRNEMKVNLEVNRLLPCQ